MANVVVFIPPPVEPGEAPIHIKNINNNKVGRVKSAIFTSLNLAVLVVAELKKDIAE
jgi:hypothetical protein